MLLSLRRNPWGLGSKRLIANTWWALKRAPWPPAAVWPQHTPGPYGRASNQLGLAYCTVVVAMLGWAREPIAFGEWFGSCGRMCGPSAMKATHAHAVRPLGYSCLFLLHLYQVRSKLVYNDIAIKAPLLSAWQ